MPISPALAENLAGDVVALYAEAERLLLQRIARALARGLDSPHWAEQKLLEVQFLQHQTQRLVAQLGDRAAAQVAVQLAEAYNRGGASAASDLAALLKVGLAEVSEPLLGLPAVEFLVAETTRNLIATSPRITQAVRQIFQSVITDTAAQVMIGTQTRRQATQAALDRFAAKGITGFVDRAGRGWNLESYTEMAMRTGCGHAAVQGHTDRLQEHGLDLVIGSDAPRECPLCLVAGTVVEGPVVELRCRLEYSGDLISLSTASGKHLSGTPDHTVLTPGGWRCLKDLHPGDQVISHSGQKRDPGVVPDHEQVPAFIEDAGKLRAPLLLSGPARRDLDSDITYREVHVVAPDGLLRDEIDAPCTQPLGDLSLIERVGLGTQGFRLRDLATRLLRLARTTPSLVGPLDHLTALLRGCLSPATFHVRGAGGAGGWGVPLPAFGGQRERLAPSPHVSPSAPHVVGHLTSADAEGGAKLRRALAGNVAPDEITSLSVSQFTGHVWDLQTGPNWYFSNGILSHNCRPWEGKVMSISGRTPGYPTLSDARAAGWQHCNCRHSISAYQEGITRPMTDTEDPAGYAATTKLRYLERQTRAAKRVEAAAMSEEARKSAGAKVRAYQAKIRAHVASTSAKRQPVRERLGAV